MISRKILLALFIAILVSMCLIGLTVQAQQGTESLNRKSIKTLIDEMKVLKDKGEKLKHIQLLREALPQTEEEIQSVVGLLDDEDVDNKCVAMELLGKIKEKRAIPKIIANLKHKNDKVKMTAAVMLGEIGDESAVEPLLENPDLMVLEFGQSPLAKIGAPALPKLIKVAKKKSLLGLLPKQPEKDRRSKNAVYAIGQMRDRNAIPTLMTLLHEEDNDLRLAAVQALAAMDVREAYPDFERMLKDKNIHVRAATLGALIKANKEKYLPTAIEFLDKDVTPDDAYILKRSIDMLGQLKEENAIPKLEKLLNHREGSIRHYAATALWRITGKVYKYKKDRRTEGEEISYKKMIKSMLKRGENKKFIEHFLRETQQERGYLWEYTLDELIKEIESSGDKYDYK